MSIRYDIPTYLSDFTELEDGRTKVKLKAFYIGETGDGRVFSKEFSDKLIQSLPNCPVVGFFSQLKDDFCGHNSTQYIYGIVPSNAEFGFEKGEDGKEWFITDVLLYTDRYDNIGEIAQKIVGHPHSLEMNPDTVKYEIKRENGKRKLYFTDGSLLGLSVLGMQEKPAFTGSEFFEENNDLRERFEDFISFLENKDRGASMDKELFEKLYSFVALSYDEKAEKVQHAIMESAGDSCWCYVVQMMDEYAVVEAWDETGRHNKRVNYTINEDGSVILGDFEDVLCRYITEVELASIPTSVPTAEESFKAEEDEEKKEKKEDEESEPVEEEKDDEEDEDEDEKEKESKAAEIVNDATEESFENVDTSNEGDANEQLQTFSEEQEQEEDNQPSDFATSDNSEEGEIESLTEALSQCKAELESLRADQAELEQFRLEKRNNLVNSYKEELPADTIASFMELAKNCSYDELEAKLAIEYVKVSKEHKQNNVAFSFSGMNFNTSAAPSNSYEDLVKRYSNK